MPQQRDAQLDGVDQLLPDPLVDDVVADDDHHRTAQEPGERTNVVCVLI